MECNKDYAVRAKEIAEQKLRERDIAGARMYALEAHRLFPELIGLPQFLDIINVYVAHERQINGVPDYYGILRVDPFADVDIIRKQYRRMSLSIHPDKNKSAGANEAFVILSQACDVLSDKKARDLYDSKLNIMPLFQTGSTTSSSAKCTATTTSQHNTSSATPDLGKETQCASSRDTPATAAGTVGGSQNCSARRCPSRSKTFWTKCDKCMIEYEYPGDLVNKYLLCPSCKQPFLATLEPVPVHFGTSTRPWPFPPMKQDKSTAASCQPACKRGKRKH